MASAFSKDQLHVSQADAGAAAALVSALADLTLVIDDGAVIEEVFHNLDAQSAAGISAWRGQPIEEVVRDSSHPTLRNVLRRVRRGHDTSRFGVSHILDGRRDLPVQYAALKIGDDGKIVLAGRDLRPITELQSRLLANQQSLEQNVRNLRKAEAHYRLLFETASDAIVIIDAANGRIREANAHAAEILGLASGVALGGRKISSLFSKPQKSTVQAMLAGVLASGSPMTMVLPSGAGEPIMLTAELFRTGDLKLVLVRMSKPAEATEAATRPEIALDALVRNATEAILVTDEAGRILWANESFLALTNIPLAAHAVGRSLGDFLQWNGIDQDVLLQTLQRNGRVHNLSGTVEGANGQTIGIDLSAIVMPDGVQPGYGFVMRPNPAEGKLRDPANTDLTRAAENLVEMVGRVPMKDLVRDTTDVIEKMCIEAALNLTENNRTSAARALGLSRQSLYAKMARLGIEVPDDDDW